ncbi:uncharacterized membrane protein C3orf80 homolog [Pygocentrus nattereri]|uniref:Uncharacterized protein n=1 Tax=Pygocentrus nattereri TaxID=42514 RepID=A0A3B4DJG3_PYGNA|nr:uncharacterized membrane protein C3orf80 homolog [Pygocentrus nattereri]
MGACLAVLAALALRACQASRDCGDVRCGEHERCCARGNNSTSNGNGSGAATRAFLDGAGWLARKLSGVLILLLLFVMGYFVQRVVCPRPRGRRERARASQDTLLTTPPPPLEPGAEFTWPAPLPPPPRLPAYDEVKHLPTYEESVQEVEEEEEEEEEGLGGRRSEDNLLEAAGPLRRPREERRTAARQTRSSRNSV